MNLISGTREGYDLLVNAIIRPPRAQYDIRALGALQFPVGDAMWNRTDFDVTNNRGHQIKCSHFEPLASHRPQAELPCVIYLHGNCGCRLEGLEIGTLTLPYFITLVVMDCSGSGQSEGEYVSLGYYEKEDVKSVVSHLRASGRTSKISLWGRSMGAATALMVGCEDPSIASLICDSPFSSLRDLAVDLCNSPQVPITIPRLAVSLGLKFIRRSIIERAEFDINDLNPSKSAESCFMPVLFVHGEEDHFIKPAHSLKILERYAGDKNRILVPGDHNSVRPRFFKDSASIFLHNTLLDHEGVLHGASTTDSVPFDVPGGGEYHMHSIFEAIAGARHPHAQQTMEDAEEAMLQQALLLSLQEQEGGRSVQE